MDDPLFSDNAVQARFHIGQHGQRRQLVRALFTQAESDEDSHSDLDTPSPSRKLGNKLCQCGRQPILYQREDGTLCRSMARCNSRICPTCGPYRVRELEGRVTKMVKNIDDARLLTLTLQSSDRPLADQLQHLREAFKKLRRTKAWKSHVIGGCHVFECTYNKKTDRWHPHLHVVLDGIFWKQSKIADLWEIESGGSRICDIRRVPSRSALVKYLAKYVSKSQTPGQLPSRRLVEWAFATHGLRIAQTFGTLHGRKLDDSTKPEKLKLTEVGAIAPIADAAVVGDLRASRLMRSIQQACKYRISDGESVPSPHVVRLHRSLACRVRSWWERRTKGQNFETQFTPRPPKQLNRTRDRPQWLWQESDAPENSGYAGKAV